MTYSPEDERFLADVHVGVLHVAAAAGTLATPIWYRYEPGQSVQVITSATSRKGRAIQASGRFGILAQVETVPYRYVSVEGPVIDVRPAEHVRDLVPMSVRYLGQADGEHYAQAWRDAAGDHTQVFTMRPERWSAADLTEEFASVGLPGGNP